MYLNINSSHFLYWVVIAHFVFKFQVDSQICCTADGPAPLGFLHKSCGTAAAVSADVWYFCSSPLSVIFTHANISKQDHTKKRDFSPKEHTSWETLPNKSILTKQKTAKIMYNIEN